jgi:hypothetical protein
MDAVLPATALPTQLRALRRGVFCEVGPAICSIKCRQENQQQVKQERDAERCLRRAAYAQISRAHSHAACTASSARADASGHRWKVSW